MNRTETKLLNQLASLKQKLGDRFSSELAIRRIYATDASIYEEIPLAVAFPNSNEDIRELIRFAHRAQVGLIPRAAGTSLAGQVVGSGIVVDVSRYLNQVMEVDLEESWVRLQPGVVRDELNRKLEPYRLWFAPETSTANRATVGGMLGNNSCGANSIRYGTTRDHVLEVSGLLSDGTYVTLGPADAKSFESRCSKRGLEGEIYRQLRDELRKPTIRQAIAQNYPNPQIHRRNTGLAIDALLKTIPFGGVDEFCLAKLIAGSEGTLLFVTDLKLRCEKLTQTRAMLLCPHFHSMAEALAAAQYLMEKRPVRCELIDENIIAGAMRNQKQNKNLSFIHGAPKAILMVEYDSTDRNTLQLTVADVVCQLKAKNLGYAYPILETETANQAWELRKAGLGVLHNQTGPEKPIALIEDMAVALQDYPAFAAEVNQTLKESFGLSCVHYGHLGAGELHLRPNLDLSNPEHLQMLRPVGAAMSRIVKKYRGSLSGEHGDGRLRSEFIRHQIGDECFALIERIKRTWDPAGIYNPGKIFAPAAMNMNIRSTATDSQFASNTIFKYRDKGGFVAASNSCSGSGDCRKSHLASGTMCPSFQATKNEYDSTRARANLLRQLVSSPNFDLESVRGTELDTVVDAMDLCLSCKACKSECPSNVDMAKLKSEVLHASQTRNGVSLKTRSLSSLASACGLVQYVQPVANLCIQNRWSAAIFKRIMGIHPQRSLPKLSRPTLRTWFEQRNHVCKQEETNKKVLFVCDEITNYFDATIGIAAIEVLESLGYPVVLSPLVDSGRSAMSTGRLKQAKARAQQNIAIVTARLEPGMSVVGTEPSSILAFRDEYVDLVEDDQLEDAEKLKGVVATFEEFLVRQIDNGHVSGELFRQSQHPLRFHAHCHEKALGSTQPIQRVLELCSNEVEEIDSGCCGMAGFFGYEKGKYDLSMQIGELRLFPAIRNSTFDTIIAATGHSCRHQILDGVFRSALHPAQLLRRHLKG